MQLPHEQQKDCSCIDFVLIGSYLRVHLHPATVRLLRHRCNIAPKSNLLFWCYTVTPSISDMAAMSPPNGFATHPTSEQHRSDVADVVASLSLDVNGLLLSFTFTTENWPNLKWNYCNCIPCTIAILLVLRNKNSSITL